MFIRTKKIKGKKYAYIVENSWKRKKVKQKVKKYLGRVYDFERKETLFDEFVKTDIHDYLDKKSARDIITDLARWELTNHGFKETKQGWVNGVCVFDVTKQWTKRPAALAFNEGFLSHYALSRLLRFYEEGTEEEIGYKLAKMFVEAGIAVPQEVFVSVFQKVFKEITK